MVARRAALRFLALVGLVGPLLGPTRTDAGWTNVNPGGGGAFTCVAAGPTGIVIVGSDISGAYRSQDRGATWDDIGYLNGGLEKGNVSAVAFDPVDAGVVYLGAYGGLYRSADAGRTFARAVPGGFWSAIAVAAADPHVVYAARQSSYNTADPQIYRSSNQGASWALVGSLPQGTRVLKLAVRPDDPTQLFALSGYERLLASVGQPRRALFVSDDGGATWNDAHGDSTAGGMTGNPWDAAYDPVHPDTIYATSVTGDNPDTSPTWSGATWRRSQAGGTWAQVSTHTGAILVHLTAADETEVITIDVRRNGPCAECGPFRSIDSGISWAHVSDMTGWDAAWNGSIHWGYNAASSGIAKTIGLDASDPSVLYWVTTQFAWKSSNDGATFASAFTDPVSSGRWRGRGINNVAPAALSASGGRLYAGFYDLGIWTSSDGGTSWQSGNDAAFTGSWKGKGGNCMTLLADPGRSSVVWAAEGDHEDHARLLRSTAGGAPGSWVATSGISLSFVTGLCLDPTSPGGNRTLYVSSDGDVYKSVDDGQSWQKVFDCDSCYVTGTDGATLFTGGQKGLWRSFDGGTTWSEIDPGTFHKDWTSAAVTTAKWNGPHDVLVRGDTAYVAVYGDQGGLYRSFDRGETWARILTDGYARTIHRDAFGSLYYGSSSATGSGGTGSSGALGLQVSNDDGETWSDLTAGLPWPFVWPITTWPADAVSVRIAVGSPGSGVWNMLAAGRGLVDVGPRLRSGLRLAGFRPNPASGRLVVAFALPSSDPATLEIFDVAGRRLLRRDLGRLEPGPHVVPLEPWFAPPAGVYLLRLRQGAYHASVTSTVVR